jgi:hypothetical protein
VRELQNVIERAVITAHDGCLNLDRALPEASTPTASIRVRTALAGSDPHGERTGGNGTRQYSERARSGPLEGVW